MATASPFFLLILDGHAHSLTVDASAITNDYSGQITWNSGEISLSGGSTFVNSGDYTSLTLDAGSGNLTLTDSTLIADDSNAVFAWTSGNLAFLAESDFVQVAGPYAVPLGSSLTLDSTALLGDFTNAGTIIFTGDADLTDATLSGGSWNIEDAHIDDNLTIASGTTVTVTGTLTWNDSALTQLANITNEGEIDFGANAGAQITLTGSSTGTEGSTYTLTLSDLSQYITGTVTDYYVDWGDGIGFDDIAPGTTDTTATYTYGGSVDSSTPYTITAHLMTDTGSVWVNLAQATVTIADAAPVIALDTVDGSTTTPTISGTAGISPGDSSTVTINFYQGSSATGTPVLTTTADVDPYDGTFSLELPDASALAPDTYTVQIQQTETAGLTGSTTQTFTDSQQAPLSVENIQATVDSATQITLTWDAPPVGDFITGYTISASTDWGETFQTLGTASANDTSFEATGLTELTPYIFSIVASNSAGSSDAACSDLVWTDDGILAPDVTKTSTTDENGVTTYELTWTNDSFDANAFEIEMTDAATGNYYQVASLTPAAHGEQMQYTIHADEFSDRTCRVRAVANGQSAYSTDIPIPKYGTQSIDIQQVSYDSTGVNLTWSDLAGSPDYWFFFKAPDSADLPYFAGESFFDESPTRENGNLSVHLSYDHFPLPTGVDIRVLTLTPGYNAYSDWTNISFNHGWNSPVLACDGTFTPVDPSFPDSPGTYHFSWSEVSGATSYVLYNIAESPWNYWSQLTAHWSGTDTSVDSMEIAPGGKWVVAAYNGTGRPDVSNAVNLDGPDAPTPPATPTGFAADVEDGGISLAWNNNNVDETGYDLERYIRSSSDPSTWVLDPDWTAPSLTADDTSYLDTTADYGTEYQYSLCAVEADESEQLSSRVLSSEVESPPAATQESPPTTTQATRPMPIGRWTESGWGWDGLQPKGNAIATAGATLDSLVKLMATTPTPELTQLLLEKNPGLVDVNGKAVTKGDRGLKDGTTVDVSSLLALFNKNVADNVVKNAPNFNAVFSSKEAATDPKNAAELNKFFVPGNTGKADCAWATHVVYNKALMDSIRPGEYYKKNAGNDIWSLKDHHTLIQRDPKTGDPVTELPVGEHAYIQNSPWRARQAWVGENILYLGNGKYWGFGESGSETHDLAGWKAEVGRHLLPGRVQEKGYPRIPDLQPKIESVDTVEFLGRIFDYRKTLSARAK